MIVPGIDLNVRSGTMTVLVEVNSADEPTLMRASTGIRPATVGHVKTDGRDLSRLRPWKRVQLMVFVAQEKIALEGPSLSKMVALG